ncbi:MAG: hypothetical protein HC938_12515 [Nitrospira sp.]|nr:hypothetical protein [Nitrospira sp.]
MPRADERGVALLLALLVLTLLTALILEFDAEARREYRAAATFRDDYKASMLTRAAVQATRAVLAQDLLREKMTGQKYDGRPTSGPCRSRTMRSATGSSPRKSKTRQEK